MSKIAVNSFIFRLISHDLIKGSVWLFFGTIVSSFIIFLTNLFLLRNLSIVDYGIYASIVALYNLSIIPAASVTNAIVRFATEYFTKSKYNYALWFYLKNLKIFSITALFIIIIFSTLSTGIAGFLKIDSSIYIILISFAIGLFYISNVNNSYLLSILSFPYLAFSSIVSSTVRLLLVITLVFSGYHVYGAILSIFISIFVGFILKFIPLKFLIKYFKSKKVKIGRKEFIKYAFPSMLAILSISSLSSTDIILAKHFLSPHDAGLYGGLSLIGKIILYSTSPIVSVMFPIITKKFEQNQRFDKTFYLAVSLVAIPSFIMIIVYFILPNLIISFFLDRSAFFAVSNMLWYFGLFGAICAIIQIFTFYFLSIKKTKVVLIVGGFALLQILLIVTIHANIFNVILSSLIAALLLLISLVIFYIYNYKKLMIYIK